MIASLETARNRIRVLIPNACLTLLLSLVDFASRYSRDLYPSPGLQRTLGHGAQVPIASQRARVWDVLARVDDVDFHLGVELEACQELGCNEEVLTCALLAGNVHHALMDHAFIARVHALVDLVDDAEGGLGKVL